MMIYRNANALKEVLPLQFRCAIFRRGFVIKIKSYSFFFVFFYFREIDLESMPLKHPGWEHIVPYKYN